MASHIITSVPSSLHQTQPAVQLTAAPSAGRQLLLIYMKTERPQQFIDVPNTTQFADNKLPDKHHAAAASMLLAYSGPVDALPEKVKKHQRTESCTKPCPGKRNDSKYYTFIVQGNQNGNKSNYQKRYR